MSHHMSSAELLALALAQEQEHALILLDADARVVGWSAAAQKLLGWNAEEMAGETLARIFTPEDLARGALDWELRAACSYGKAEDDRWQVRKDGLRMWVSGTVTALRDASGAAVGYCKILRDRTDLRSHVETLQARLAEAGSAEHEKHVLLGTLAHELRGPLGPLANAVQLIRLAAPDTPQVASSVQIIQRQVRFIETLVQDLLETTRAGLGKVRLHYETVDLRAIIDDALETCSALVHERGQKVEVLIPDVLSLEADRVRMQQVIVNLVTNASKFSPRGSTIWIKADAAAGEAVLRVEDAGKGIPAELLPRIFELFTQAGGHGASTGHGLGLGLALVKTIVEMHGGSVHAKSEGCDRGAEILVRLPLRRGDDAVSPGGGCT